MIDFVPVSFCEHLVGFTHSSGVFIIDFEQENVVWVKSSMIMLETKTFEA